MFGKKKEECKCQSYLEIDLDSFIKLIEDFKDWNDTSDPVDDGQVFIHFDKKTFRITKLNIRGEIKKYVNEIIKVD